MGRLSKGPDRVRSETYLRYVRTKPCLICGGQAEAHHLTFAQPRAKGRKNGDQWTVPLCHGHHMELHDFAGGERSWWAINGILPMIWAEDAYQQWLYGKYSEWSETNGSDDE